jgi:arabinofuranosyltransferase
VLRNPARNAFVAITLLFCAWSAAFIVRTSHLATDGHRYFCLFDDAMISMRYAWNLSHGTGLVWNAGERVQGYTNLLMTLIMSAATYVFERSAAVLSVQILGIALMLGTASIAAAISRALHHAPSSRDPIVFFLVLGYYPLVYWSLLGMETGLLALLLAAGVWSALRYVRDGRTQQVLASSLCFGLAVLTRMDGVLFAVLTFGYLAWVAVCRGSRRTWWHVAVFAAIVAVFVIGQTMFQYSYYGEPLPNTYTLKLTGMPLMLRLQNGAGFVGPFVRESAVILLLAVAGAWLTRTSQAVLLIAPLVTGLSYEVYVGGDPWNYWRIMAPCMPLALVLVSEAVDAIAAALRGASPRWPVSRWPAAPHAIVAAGCALLVLLSASVRFLPEISLLYKPLQTGNGAENIETALILDRLTTPEATVAVLFAGTIPYYLDRRAIDVLGKSDRYIAHLPPDLSGSVSWAGMSSVPGHNKYDFDYSIKRLAPTYVQVMRWGRADLTTWASSHYVSVEERGVKLWLLSGSPDVRWSRVSVPGRPQGQALE